MEKDSRVPGPSVYHTNEVINETKSEVRLRREKRKQHKPSYLRVTKDDVVGSIKQGFGKVFGNDEMEGSGKTKKIPV
ncbi:4358_t:CDS:2 [Funneliformis geosporum]|uniref:7441_t:CDS:1 n=1 Tax=Funneliformis geosporum TaxID=1117311 RepID=A0A9W4SB65_9GLOM|nr:7441_t:CDS:2 [Funneliformis geosporum]CAI2164013.1 4358_t:CDS:2 [Funneliformis geosporum]